LHDGLCKGVEVTDEEKKVIKKDYHWIKIDQTKHWNKKFLATIGPDARIIATFVFDHNSATHCCEITPSYKLHLAGTEFKTSRELSDAEREDIEDKISAAEADCEDIEYHHCSTIDERTEKGVKIPGKSKPIRQFENCDDDVKIEEVIEYYKGNPW
jgi:hypothetical protein